MAFKKILVPVDFSEFSDKATEYAMYLAEKFGADITLLHAVVLFEDDIDEEEHLQAYEKILEKKEDARSKKMKAHRKRAETRKIRVDSILLRGLSAGDVILEFIEEKDFDLVVMGTHGRTGLGRWISGSVAEKVVRFSKKPVLTIHKDFFRLDIKKILAPVDFSAYSTIGVKQAIAVAKAFDAKIVFFHVVVTESHPEFYAISDEPILSANPALKTHIIKNLKKLTSDAKDIAQYAVCEGSVHKEIKEFVENNQVDLIVMPTRGMSELEHFFLGSTTERVVRIAPCPVLTVRR